jgi:SH3-like domain-containing protein
MKTFMTNWNAATCMAAFCLVTLELRAQSPSTAPAAAPTVLYTTIGERPAILYDGLSTKANKIFILTRNHPLEVLVRLDKWTKVRDADGTNGWVENSALGDRRHVQVSSQTADVRVMPMATAALVFEAQRGVLLEVTAPPVDGWLAVRHRDGQSGFMRSVQAWGI